MRPTEGNIHSAEGLLPGQDGYVSRFPEDIWRKVDVLVAHIRFPKALEAGPEANIHVAVSLQKRIEYIRAVGKYFGVNVEALVMDEVVCSIIGDDGNAFAFVIQGNEYQPHVLNENDRKYARLYLQIRLATESRAQEAGKFITGETKTFGRKLRAISFEDPNKVLAFYREWVDFKDLCEIYREQKKDHPFFMAREYADKVASEYILPSWSEWKYRNNIWSLSLGLKNDNNIGSSQLAQ